MFEEKKNILPSENQFSKKECIISITIISLLFLILVIILNHKHNAKITYMLKERDTILKLGTQRSWDIDTIVNDCGFVYSFTQQKMIKDCEKFPKHWSKTNISLYRKLTKLEKEQQQWMDEDAEIIYKERLKKLNTK